MENWRIYFLVGLGGGLGSVARFWISAAVSRCCGEAFPWGTLFANVTGSFLIGLAFTLTASDGRFPWPETTSNFFVAGICGGYTTFSAFSLQTLRLLHERQWLNAGFNVFGSVFACLFAVWLGQAFGLLLSRPR
jgi:CrcB protein